jgi:hypothetical protein
VVTALYFIGYICTENIHATAKKNKNNQTKTLIIQFCKKSLKIPKGQSETVYRRRTDNTMAKRKSTKWQTTIDKTYI